MKEQNSFEQENYIVTLMDKRLGRTNYMHLLRIFTHVKHLCTMKLHMPNLSILRLTLISQFFLSLSNAFGGEGRTATELALLSEGMLK